MAGRSGVRDCIGHRTTAVDHGAQAPVADRKSVDPLFCRLFVPEGEGVGLGMNGFSEPEAAREWESSGHSGHSGQKAAAREKVHVHPLTVAKSGVPAKL